MDSPSLGIAAGLGSAILWAYASARFKPLLAVYGPFAVNLFKAGLGAVLFWLTTGVLAATGIDVFAGCGTHEAIVLALSGAIGLAAGDYCYFVAIDRVGVRQATLLHGTAPLWLLIMSFLGSGAQLSTMQTVGILLVVGGVLDVTRRRVDHKSKGERVRSGTIFGLLSAVGQAFGIIVAKSPTDACENPLLISAVRLSGAVAGLVIIAALLGQIPNFLKLLRERDGGRRAVEPIFLGTFLGVLCMTVAIDESPEAVAGAILSLTPVFAVPVSYWLFGEPVRWQTLIGTCIAAGGVALISLG